MQAVGKIHDKDKTEESHCEEEKDKQGSQERVQPAVYQLLAHRHLLNTQTLLKSERLEHQTKRYNDTAAGD